METQVEDHPPGYPRFTALIGSHESFNIFRRFATVRARMLLHKQDKIILLEQQLASLDAEEPRRLFLGNFRRDYNEARNNVLAKLDIALHEYDDLLERSEKALKRSPASLRSIRNLQNWLDDTSCIARDETAYLSQANDLVVLATPNDGEIKGLLQACIEDVIIFLSNLVGKSPKCRKSRNANVHIFPQALIDYLIRVIITIVLIALLFVPVSSVRLINGAGKRLAIILVSSMAFVVVLGVMGKTRTADLFMAGATYATVLIVFVV